MQLTYASLILGSTLSTIAAMYLVAKIRDTMDSGFIWNLRFVREGIAVGLSLMVSLIGKGVR